MDSLPDIWFVIIAVLWFGFLFLEGFDLGVGMLMKFFARDEKERRVMLNSIGPVWDGNEVWLLTAIGGTFAAFPMWYASMLSALYLPLTLTLLALIFRAVSIEYRGKGASDRWRRNWTTATAVGSGIAALSLGAMLGLTTTGMPIDERGNIVGGPFTWLTVEALIGGLAVLCFSLLQGLLFLCLKTDGPVREHARGAARRWGPLLLVPMVLWVFLALNNEGSALPWPLVALPVVALGAVIWALLRNLERTAFVANGLFLLLSLGAIFGALFPRVMPSTLDPAFDLTITNAQSSGYTLGVMLAVTAVFIPLVILYQAWSYRVFRSRLRTEHIPEAHRIPVAIRGR